MFALPMTLAAHGDWSIATVAQPLGTALLIWGTVLYVWTGLLYTVQRADRRARRSRARTGRRRTRGPVMKRTDSGIRRNPVPSLLQSLMNDHLDPGYEGAAEDREQGHSRQTRVGQQVWIAIGALLVGLVLSVAYRQATERDPAAPSRCGPNS